MALKNFQFDAIMRDYHRRQLHHKHILDEHIRIAHEKLPELGQLDDQEAEAAADYGARMIGGDETASARLEQILKDDVFHDFYTETPKKFKNVTNGIAHRRWLNQSNLGLAALLSETIGDGYRKDPEQLEKPADTSHPVQ